MSATPVGHLYTPQQLMGSVKYGSGVLLGNWREDDALDDMRMADYIELKEEVVAMCQELIRFWGSGGKQITQSEDPRTETYTYFG